MYLQAPRQLSDSYKYTKICLHTAFFVCVSVPILSILIVLMFVLIAYLRKYASSLFLYLRFFIK